MFPQYLRPEYPVTNQKPEAVQNVGCMVLAPLDGEFFAGLLDGVAQFFNLVDGVAGQRLCACYAGEGAGGIVCGVERTDAVNVTGADSQGELCHVVCSLGKPPKGRFVISFRKSPAIGRRLLGVDKF